MRLLVVSSWFPCPPDNGSRLRAYHLIRHLARKHAVTLLSFGSAGREDDLATMRSLCEHVETVTVSRPAGDRAGVRGLLSPVPRHFVQNDSPDMRALVERHVPGHSAAIGLQVDAARYLRRYTSVPRVFEEVEVTVYREQYLGQTHPMRRIRRGLTWWKFRHFIRRLVDGFERATVVSTRELEYLRAIGCAADRLALVPNGIEAPAITRRAVSPDRLIYPGSVTYSANLDAVRFFIRDILPRLRRVRTDLTLCVTGSTQGVEVSDLAVPGVTFTGRLPEVDSLVADSVACVVPLRIGGGTRLKVLQAMALGTPVVATTKGIEGLDLEPERHVLVGDGAAAFAEQVLRVLDDPGLADRLSQDARRLVRERYSWEPIGDELERVVAAAVDAHGARHGAESPSRLHR